MIFSRFFKEKWQHKDAAVRIEAIENELDAVKDKTLLLELLNNDDSDLVRRDVLIKLADFDIWLDAFANNSQSKVQQFAQKNVEQILFDQHELKLSHQQKLSLLNSDQITTLKKAVSLEAWLKHEQSAELVLALFEKINKPQQLLTTFSQKQNAEIQLALVANVTDIELLEKLVKKAHNHEVTDYINNVVAKQKALLEKPIKLRKQLQLLLSKLLALKEVSDYKVVLEKRAALEQEWQSVTSELNCLADEEQQSLQDKYQTISSQLDKLFVAKAEAYQQQLIAEQLDQDKQNARVAFSEKIAAISQQLTTAIFESKTVAAAVYQAKLSDLLADVDQSVLNADEKNSFKAKLTELENTLANLTVIAESISEATHLISTISQVQLPTDLAELNERQPIFNDWLQQFKQVQKKASGIFPESISSAFNEIKSQWLSALEPLNKQQKSLLTQTQKKISEFNRLVNNGKYNACFGVFKRIEQLHQQLNHHQKHRIERDFQRCQEKITELGDWEHYIATPRKEELLAQIQALVEQPLDNPNKQAEKVKAFRKQWNLLGHADEELEQGLNQAFNEACEQAFAPCRLYYKEQDKLREQHLATRVQIIEHAQKMAELLAIEPIDFKTIDGQLHKIQRRWREAGQVERAKYKEVNQQFNDVINPVKEAIKAFHQENINLKTKLISEAEQASSLEDISEAVNLAKTLQQQWKTIGYCGPREENKLWKAFRQINDAIFAKLDAAKKAEQSEHEQQQQAFEQEFAELEQQSAATSAEFTQLISALKELQSRYFELKLSNKAFVKNIEQFIKKQQAALTECQSQEQKIHWQKLFVLLEKLTKAQFDEQSLLADEFYISCNHAWQKKLHELVLDKRSENRADKTLELEILAGIDSPSQLKDERMQVQVQLMQQQMSSGAQVNLEKALQEWLALGSLTSDDSEYLARIKPIYC